MRRTGLDTPSGTVWERPDKLRLLHADVDSLVVTANFAVRLPIRRDLQRAQALRAFEDGKAPTADAVDVDTGEPLEAEAWEELSLVDDPDAWEETRTLGDQGFTGVVVRLNGMPFQVESYPFGGYRWFLRSEFCDLWLNPEKTQQRPAAKIRLSPQFLALNGAAGAWRKVKAMLESLAVHGEQTAGGILEAKVQRIDIKVDFLGAGWIGVSESLNRMVTRAVKGDWYMLPYGERMLSKSDEDTGVAGDDRKVRVGAYRNRKRETGWALGSKDNIEVGCYDKTFEIGLKQGAVPAWQRTVWVSSGDVPMEALDPKSPSDLHVWRLEGRFSGNALRAFKVRYEQKAPRRELDTPEDVLACVADLWRYLTEGWLRMVNPTATRLHRCPTNETWRALSEWPRGHGPDGNATFANPPHVDLGRDKAGVQKAEQTIPAIFGAMSSFLAAAGPRETLALAKRVMPEANAVDASAYIAGQMMQRYAKRKALPTVADRMFGESLKKEARLSVIAGMRPSVKLQEMILTAARSLTDEDADRVFYEKIAAARKERERRKKKQVETAFEGVDLNVPAHRAAYEKLLRQQEQADQELRDMFDGIARELLGLEEDEDVSAVLLGEAGHA